MPRSPVGFTRLAGLLLLAAACTEPPEPVATVALSPASASIGSGATQTLTATVSGTKGTVLTDRAITWSSGNPSLATVSATGTVTAGRVLGPTNESVTITATSESIAGSASVSILPVPVGRVTVAGTTTLRPNATTQLSAATASATGEVLTGRTLTWSSADALIATVSSTGLVTATAYTGPSIRTVSVTATAESQGGTATVTVTPLPVATVTIDRSAIALRLGETATLTTVTRDSAGTTLTERTTNWSSAAPAIATVSASGVVTGISAGTTTVTATVEGRTASATIIVSSTSVPVIATIAPGTVTAGTTASITGIGFATTTSGNSVRIGGAAATVLTATATLLTVRVPCTLSGAAPVVVTVDGAASAPVAITMTTTRHALPIGGYVLRETSSDSRCNELVSSGSAGRYLVMISSSATSANTLIDVAIGGNPATALASSAPTTPVRVATAPSVSTVDARREQAHLAHLERERERHADLVARGLAFPAPVTRRPAAVAPPQVGDMRTLYYNFSNCSDSTRQIRGRAIYTGSRAIIWEDSANSLQSAATPVLAGYYQSLGQIFDRDQYDAVRAYFGDPLRRDAETDGDGRLHMVFTQRLNGTGAAAYVTSCDQYPRSTYAASNFGEFFYATVPTTATLNLNSSASPDGWYAFIGRTVVHEVKHIASLAARVANRASSFEQSWLEEGTARHAEEVWVRDSLHRIPWKGNTGYGTPATNGVACDFNLADATCLAKDPLRRPTWGMRRQFNELLPKLTSPWDWSPFGDGTGQTGSVFYQTVWSLVRFASDRYGTSDRQFLTALTQATTTGTTNLAAATGIPFDRLLAQWGLALYADDLPGLSPANPDLGFGTWNFRDIYGGLSSDPAWRSRFTTPYPLTVTRFPAGSFSTTRTGIRGGGTAYFEVVSAVPAGQVIAITGTGGADIPSSARVAILRLP